jgi:hypothetical protein
MVSYSPTKEKPMSNNLIVFGFAPDWGLPTTGPFALKLVTWLNAHGISFSFKTEMNTGKGPKGKSPWVQLGSETLADSNKIIKHIAMKKGIAIAQDVTDPKVAAAYALQVAFEERMHQILEWELFCTNQGLAFIKRAIEQTSPPILAGLIYTIVRRGFRKQLYARGISRHSNDEIFALGEELITALETYLENGGFPRIDHDGDKPSIAEMGVFGQVGLMATWPMSTPVANRIKASDIIQSWVQDIKSNWLSPTTENVQNIIPPRNLMASTGVAQ